MKKLFHLIMAVLVMTVISVLSAKAQAQPQVRDITGDTCRNAGILFTSVAEADKSLNLSSAFVSSNVVEYTYTTSWQGSMTCTYGNIGIGGLAQDHLYYFTAFNDAPVYLHFNKANSESSYWIKLTSTITGNTKVNVNGIVGIHSLAYQTEYTLRAELLTAAPAGVENYTKTTSSGALTVIPAVMSGSGSGSDGWALFDRRNYARRAWDNMMAETPRKSWSTSDFLAYEKLTIQFDPKETTCNMTRDMSVKLPPAPYNILKKNGRAEGADFTIPLRCGNLAGIKSSTRNVQAWLSSNDLLSTDSSYQIMVNAETTAGGVGIAIRSRSFMGVYEEVRLSSSNNLEHADKILEIDKGDDISMTQYIYLHAYYRVYDASKLSTGNVVATAQIIFGYD
ncbi:fimbrial protein [Enterobacter cancerogenus]|uniref:fimbrial protein n=1 Tax=Enterobacter cancerogenus TaxID=69218 RepID=UPI0019267BAC|nr:fimbrial protein [Enterobacter cancerogenus]CAD5355486.1 Fimbrial protein [Enterobacter cancerogenus]